MNDFHKILVEVDEILSYLDEKDLERIPQEIRQLIKDNKDKDYTWEYDDTKSLEEQNVSDDTIAFLSYLNMKYILNDEQRELMQQILEFNEEKLQEAISKNYEKDDIFKKDKKINKV